MTDAGLAKRCRAVDVLIPYRWARKARRARATEDAFAEVPFPNEQRRRDPSIQTDRHRSAQVIERTGPERLARHLERPRQQRKLQDDH